MQLRRCGFGLGVLTWFAPFAACGGAGDPFVMGGDDASAATVEGGDGTAAYPLDAITLDAASTIDATTRDARDALDVSTGADVDADAPASPEASVDAPADTTVDVSTDAHADAGALAWLYVTPLEPGNAWSGLYGYEWNGNAVSLTEIDMDPGMPGVQGVIGGAGMVSIVATSSGKFVYTANVFDGTIGAYAVAAATGVLSRIDVSSAAGTQDRLAAASPSFVAVHPTADKLYVALENGAVETLVIDPISGVPTHASTTSVGGGPAAIAVDPKGRYFAVANSVANSVTMCLLDGSGLPTAVDADAGSSGRQDFDTGVGPLALSFDRSGAQLYVTHENGVSAYAVDTVTGALSALPAVIMASGLRYATAVHKTADVLYVATYSSGVVQPFSIASATPVSLSGDAAVNLVRHLEFEPAGKFLFANSDDKRISVFGVDSVSGALTSRNDIATWRATGSNTFAFVRR